jgi:hypothetical protein
MPKRRLASLWYSDTGVVHVITNNTAFKWTAVYNFMKNAVTLNMGDINIHQAPA